MGFPSLTRAALQQATRKNELIIETGKQIQKDFAEFGFTIHFSEQADIFYDELFHQMKFYVADLLANNMEQFMHFLYRIDVSEQQIAMYQNEMPDSHYDEVITELIIHRELKKVITRDYFRQQSKQNSNELT
ncbi:hypothetical protein [Saccharicrinis aurantiacus]|uniref:hypothetical protein n=1 Tax=Saccharicrinis aurantiacus TaxID=1849719 RepID=UPI000839128D|nr:hypothetical protein [Saccharicrinis aurantiacus]